MPDVTPVPKSVCEARHQSLEDKVEELRRVDEKRLDAHHEDIAELKKLQVQNTMILKQLADQQAKMDTRLSKIEKKPAEKWGLVVKTAITSVVSALAGGLIVAIAAYIK